MLESMRGLAKSLFAKTLLMLLVLSFAIWGVGDILRDSGASYVARVGGVPIGVGEYQHRVGQTVRQMQAAGMEISPGKAGPLVLQQMVQERLIAQAVTNSGLYVNDALVARTIASQPQFHDPNGRFNESLYRNFLRQNNLNEAELVAKIRREVQGTFLLATINTDDVLPPPAVLDLAALAENQTRDAVLFTLPTPTAAAKPDEATVQAFYDANKEMLYKQPEKRTLEYVTIPPAEIAKRIDAAVTPEMVSERSAAEPKASKEKRMGDLRAEQRDSVLRELSNDLQDALAGGASMGEAVAKTGLHAESKMLTNITADQFNGSGDALVKTVAAQGFSLNEGDVSNLLTTPDGRYLLVSTKAVVVAAPKPLAEVKADVEKRVVESAMREAARQQALEAKEALEQTPDWQAVATKYKLAARRLSGLRRPAEGKTVGDLPPPLASALFEKSVGKVAGPAANPDGRVQLLLVTAVRQSETHESPDAHTVKRLMSDMNSQIQQAVLGFLATDQGIKINPQAIIREQE